jgi:hypothetical protein
MHRHYPVIAAVIFCLAGIGISAQGPKRMVPLIRQVDHILIESSDPKALFNFFVDTLQFPIAWPVSENRGYVTAGIGFGNASVQFRGYSERKARGTPEARYSGIAFQPLPMDKALAELKVRGVPYNPPEPYVSSLPDGSRGVAWTTVALRLFSKPGMSIFLYEYSPAFLKVEVRRKQLGNRLMLSNGGPLGVLSAAEIVISTAQVKKGRESWSLLLGTPTQPGNWNAGTGPFIRLVQGKEDRIQEITLRVKSLDDAKAFLKKKKLLGSVSPGRVLLKPSAIQGLRILLQ